MATQTGASPKAYTGKAHEMVPEFGNKASEYKEDRKRVMLYERKMYLSGRQKETAFNLMSTLSGRAWSAVEDLSITDLEAEEGTKKLLERLDTVFKYDALTELPYDFETFFFHAYRRRNQTVQEYCADYEKQLRKLDQHGVTLPDKVVGWFFLRRAGLRQDQRQMIMSTLAAEKISLDTVRKAVNFVIGQDAIPQSSMATSPWRTSTASLDLTRIACSLRMSRMKRTMCCRKRHGMNLKMPMHIKKMMMMQCTMKTTLRRWLVQMRLCRNSTRSTVKPYNKKLCHCCQTLAAFLMGTGVVRNFFRAETLGAHF